jgi:hypothetical protein
MSTIWPAYSLCPVINTILAFEYVQKRKQISENRLVWNPPYSKNINNFSFFHSHLHCTFVPNPRRMLDLHIFVDRGSTLRILPPWNYGFHDFTRMVLRFYQTEMRMNWEKDWIPLILPWTSFSWSSLRNQNSAKEIRFFVTKSIFCNIWL